VNPYILATHPVKKNFCQIKWQRMYCLFWPVEGAATKSCKTKQSSLAVLDWSKSFDILPYR
jgi:hypothetical protein